MPNDSQIPESTINDLARFLIPKLQDFYSNPDNQKKFVEWKNVRKCQNGSRKYCFED